MSKSNVSDIDYSVFSTTTTEEAPAEAPKLKSEGISKRSIAKAKTEDKPRDLAGASNPANIANRAIETSNALPSPEVPDALANYALPFLGAAGTGLAAYGLFKNKDKLGLGQTIAGAPAEGMTQKTDLRNMPAKPEVAPVQQELPKPTFPQGQVQQPAVSGYGQQTLNAPTGVPNVAAPAAPVAPPAEVAPAPVDPIQAARIRKAEAEAAMAEHKLQQLQAGATQKSSGKAPPAAASESEMQMIQKGGAASVSQRQSAELKAFDANMPKPPEAIQASATPVEKQAAAVAVESKPAPVEKPISGAAGQAVEVPEGRIPSYPNPKRNKQGADVIGQGGWHWYQGQMGPEAEQAWLREFGRTNQSYNDVKQAMKEGRLPSPVLAEGKKGGAFPRETTVPNYIKGNASMKGMLGMLAGAGLLGVAGSQKGQEAMSRAASAVSDLGISPDIFAGKGEELGKLGKSYITAGNPNYIREIRAQLEVENDPARRAILQEELQKAGGSGAGRGIAPPSSYQR
jgi:hypothetical protein